MDSAFTSLIPHYLLCQLLEIVVRPNIQFVRIADKRKHIEFDRRDTTNTANMQIRNTSTEPVRDAIIIGVAVSVFVCGLLCICLFYSTFAG